MSRQVGGGGGLVGWLVGGRQHFGKRGAMLGMLKRKGSGASAPTSSQGSTVAKYAKIDVEDDDLDGKTFLVKGERGRKKLFGKGAAVKAQNHFIGKRGMIDGMDAYTHLTVADIKREEGWWWRLEKWKHRVWWRVKTLPEEYNETVKNEKWMKSATREEK